MRLLSLVQTLERFDQTDAHKLCDARAPTGVVPCEVASDIEHQKCAAFDKGFEAGLLSEHSAHADALEALRADCEARLDGQRREMAASAGETLCAMIKDQERMICESLAAMLEPEVLSAVRAHMLSNFTQSIEALLTGAWGKTCTMRGPADLIEIVSAQLGERVKLVECTVDESSPLHVVSGSSRVDEKFRQWRASLEEIAGRA